MAPPRRSRGSQRGGRSSRGRGRGGRNNRDAFRSSRLLEAEDDDTPLAPDNEPTNEDEDLNDPFDQVSDIENESRADDPYTTLLSSLKVQKDDEHRASKRRKVTGESKPLGNAKAERVVNGGEIILSRDDDQADTHADLSEMHDGEDAVYSHGEDGDVEEEPLKDPFLRQFVPELSEGHPTIEEVDVNVAMLPQISYLQNPILIKKSVFPPAQSSSPQLKTIADLKLKQRLHRAGAAVLKGCTVEDRDMAGAVFNYKDVINGCRTVTNIGQSRRILCLHALNHIFKTRDRVLKNNEKLSQQDNSDQQEYRDQGFTRPKVLIMLPTKQACMRFVDAIVEISEPEQQENKSRLLDTFSQEDDETWEDKPEDFQELFGGNHDEDFRIGMKFTRKTIKYFSGFYNSDIIIGSPLGLMRTVTTGGGKKDQKQIHDADFLSSIEVVIMDNASALQMSNWQHVEYVFSQLNLLPKESHGCDFSRVRHWYLDGSAKTFRQSIVISSYLTPEINSLVSTHLHNRSGRIKYQPIYKGAMLETSTILPFQVTQTFVRFDAPSPAVDHDARFKHFSSTVLPNLLRDQKTSSSGQGGGGTLLFIPTYLDFVRLRNHFSTSTETISLSFGTVSEYTPVRDVARARSHFASGRHSVLIYSERAHHHFRYKIRGVKKIFFYGVPDNPIFWREIVGLLGYGSANGTDGVREMPNRQGRGLVKALFSKWDVMKLERIVGTERVARLVGDKAGDTFEFI